jgi:outer membrane protein assembly factor BamB
MKYLNHFLILVITIFLTSCSEKKNPPLLGNRINVLHYDLLKESRPVKKSISIPTQISSVSWTNSEVAQFLELPHNISLAKNLKQISKFHPDKLKESFSNGNIIIVDDIMYTYSRTILAAYNISTKKNLWSIAAVAKNEISDVIDGSMVFEKGIIYLSSGGRDFIAFNSIDGSELWRFRAPNIVRYIPSIKNNQIYVSTIDNTIYSLSLDGKLIWRYDAPTYSLTNKHIYIPNIIYEDKLITVTTAGDLVILNRHNGEELTQVNLATTSIIGDGSLSKGPVSSPILVKNNLYILTGENDLIKIDLRSPEILWRQNFSGAKSYWITEHVTYLITEANQLLAVENTNGSLIWVIDLPKNPKKNKLQTFYGPILAGDQLIITSDSGEFFMISPYDGKLESSYNNGFSTFQMPIIVNNKAYFVSKKGDIAVWQ